MPVKSSGASSWRRETARSPRAPASWRQLSILSRRGARSCARPACARGPWAPRPAHSSAWPRRRHWRVRRSPWPALRPSRSSAPHLPKPRAGAAASRLWQSSRREALGVAVLRNLGVARLVLDIRSVAAVEYLDAGVRKVPDEAVGVRDLLLADHLERALQGHRVWIIRLQRDVLGPVFDVGAEATGVGDDLLAGGRLPELARQLKQEQGFLACDGVHLLAGPQAGEAGLLLVVLGSDLHERPEATHSHAHRLPAQRIWP